MSVIRQKDGFHNDNDWMSNHDAMSQFVFSIPGERSASRIHAVFMRPA